MKKTNKSMQNKGKCYVCLMNTPQTFNHINDILSWDVSRWTSTYTYKSLL